MVLYIKPTDSGFEVNIRKKGASVELTLCTEQNLKIAKQRLRLYKAFFDCESVLD